MIIPNRDPGVHLMASEKSMISFIGGMSFTVIVESVDLSIRQRNSVDGLTPAAEKGQS